MKTSNKLLMGLTIALLIIPLTVMILIANANRIDNKTYDKMITGAETIDSEADRFIKKFPVQAFQQVVINGSESSYLNIKIIANDKFLLKATNDLAPSIQYKVDKDGKLNISLKAERNYQHGTLLIFSPNLKGITFNNVSVDELSVNTDSLNVEITKGVNYRFGEDMKIKNLNLVRKTIYQEQNVVIPGITIEDAKIENLRVDINGAYLTVNNTPLRNVDLRLKDAKAEFKNEENRIIAPIETLLLNSTGKNDVNFQHVKINKTSGNLSDETSIQMPTVNLKQLLK
ncbi:hypothetical protein [Pedobacter alluvionis]|uniref:Adhesin domain-containing protein n=1 Tax=Pedobacter alluvionis TaxID=475253 RepID=A0A497Y6P0_9SPHI|nr:hypothetical protein [Pedobacter alluvionis]RLJ77757.1 hypothetical protein BCL90_2863 [Pedobacter alluvionis]TFB33045.1 hypothetical protein E3V97_03105 [Pedobacter alluvionis]